MWNNEDVQINLHNCCLIAAAKGDEAAASPAGKYIRVIYYEPTSCASKRQYTEYTTIYSKNLFMKIVSFSDAFFFHFFLFQTRKVIKVHHI